jgi:hypothetical protein
MNIVDEFLIDLFVTSHRLLFKLKVNMTTKNDQRMSVAYVENMNQSIKHFELSVPIKCKVRMRFSTFEDSLKVMPIEQMKKQILNSEEFFKFPHEISLTQVEEDKIDSKEIKDVDGMNFSFAPKELSFVRVAQVETLDGIETLFEFYRGNPFYR